MTDLQRAKRRLAGHTLCLCRGEDCITSDERGIAPLMRLLGEGADLAGYSAADKVVGRAAAFLFVLAGVREVYAEVLSEGAEKTLAERGVAYSFGSKTARIVNRSGNGFCPMETAVQGVNDPRAAYEILKKALAALAAGQGEN